jgi:hypothetical protein
VAASWTLVREVGSSTPPLGWIFCCLFSRARVQSVRSLCDGAALAG